MNDKSGLRVLIVDDQDSMRQLVRLSLRSLGITQVHEAPDGAQALEMLGRLAIDLVLLDSEMPRMDGTATLQALRVDPRFARLPVVMVTSRADADFVRASAAHGVNGYLLKPISAATLGARIDGALRGQAGLSKAS